MVSEVSYTGLLQLSKRFEMAARLAPRTMEKYLEEEIAKPIVDEMIQQAPVQSGDLKASLGYVKHGPYKISIGSQGNAYIKFVHEGTAPHEIRASEGKVLSFVVNGQRVFTKSVQHPGTKENPFITDAADKVLKRAIPRLLGVQLGPLKEGGNGKV